LARLANADNKPNRAKQFNDYVSRKIDNIRKELIRKQKAAEEKASNMKTLTGPVDEIVESD
jgi:hypothetical protein